MRRVLNKDEVIVYEFFVPKKENLDGNQVRLMSCGILPTSSPGVVASPGSPGRFVLLLASFVSLWTLLRIRGFCVPEFGNSAQHQPHVFCTCTPCQRASFNSTTDSFSWGHDPYALACKARPSFDRCGTSLTVSLSLSLSISNSITCCKRKSWSVVGFKFPRTMLVLLALGSDTSPV